MSIANLIGAHTLEANIHKLTADEIGYSDILKLFSSFSKVNIAMTANTTIQLTNLDTTPGVGTLPGIDYLLGEFRADKNGIYEIGFGVFIPDTSLAEYMDFYVFSVVQGTPITVLRAYFSDILPGIKIAGLFMPPMPILEDDILTLFIKAPITDTYNLSGRYFKLL